MTASILNLDTVLTSEFDMEQHERCCKIQIGIRANMLHHKFCSLLIDGMITLSIKQNKIFAINFSSDGVTMFSLSIISV